MGKSNVAYLYTGVLFNCHKGSTEDKRQKDPLKEANHIKAMHFIILFILNAQNV